MTARFFVNQQNTRGHRPRLQRATDDTIYISHVDAEAVSIV
jgi:hypothetical protein